MEYQRNIHQTWQSPVPGCPRRLAPIALHHGRHDAQHLLRLSQVLLQQRLDLPWRPLEQASEKPGLVNIEKAIEHGPVEIVDFPMKSMVILSSPVLPAKFWKSPIYLVGSAGENIGKPMGKSQDIWNHRRILHKLELYSWEKNHEKHLQVGDLPFPPFFLPET